MTANLWPWLSQVKEAHFRAHPEWKWSTRERNKGGLSGVAQRCSTAASDDGSIDEDITEKIYQGRVIVVIPASVHSTYGRKQWRGRG